MSILVCSNAALENLPQIAITCIKKYIILDPFLYAILCDQKLLIRYDKIRPCLIYTHNLKW